MPKKEETISIYNLDTDAVLAIAYQTFKNLNWQLQFAGGDKLLGSTVKKFSAYPQQILIGVAGNQLTISSEMTQNELFDALGKNKKNIQAFITAFEALQSNITEETIEANKQAINALREETERVAEEETRQSAEADAVMNLSTSNLYVTYGIIGINLLVFIAMAVTGVPLFEPTGLDVIKWGGNYGPLTVSGEWWRLLTNVFVHIGLIHVAFNMYALYMVGIYLEPMLGKLRYTVAYICTGIIASLVSLMWHSDNPTASAGASGAIFGLYGVFLALLSTSLIPKKVRVALLQSIGIFVVYNLVYGLKSGVDNSAHLGGLVSGLIIGYVFYFTLDGQVAAKTIRVICGSIAIVTVAIGFTVLQNSNHLATDKITAIKDEVHAADFKDVEKYTTSYNQLIEWQTQAQTPINDKDAVYDEVFSQKLQTISVPKWQQAQELLKEMESYDVPGRLQNKTRTFERYVSQRLNEINLMQQIVKGNKQASTQLEVLQREIDTTIRALEDK